MSGDSDHGQPRGRVEPKRSYDRVPVQIDWHDYLAYVREPNSAISLGQRIRFRRKDPRGTGLEYECTQSGVTGGREPVWPKTAGLTVTDGSVVWTARAVSTASLRATISSSNWTNSEGLTLSSMTTNDLIATVFVSGGTNGQEYEVKNQLALSTGEPKEGVVVLPVAD
jgi:hypothetical protein